MIIDGLTWHVGIEPNAESGAIIDSVSLWRSRQPPDSFRIVFDDLVQIELPDGIGVVSLSPDSRGGLTGSVSREDGAVGEFVAVRSQRIESESYDLSIVRPDANIAATILRPAGKGPFPGIVVTHGGGNSDRTVPPYKFWGDYLVQKGFAVLLYDKRGNGESTGNWTTVGFDTRAEDVSGMLTVLAAQSFVDDAATGLIGISQGAWVAGLAAQKNPIASFIVSISGPAVTPAVADAYAGWVASRRAGLTESEASERVELYELSLESARNSASDEAWNRLLTAIELAKQKPWFETRPFNPGPRSTIGSGWYPMIIDHDPVPILEDLEIPMLWLFGENDTQLNPAESITILRELQSSGKDYTIRVFEGADHGVAVPMTTDWRGGDYMTAAPGFFSAIDVFLASVD